MRWSLPIAKVYGTVVQIHVTFFLLLAWLGGSYYLQGGMPAAVDGLVFILLIFACVLAHEFGHVFAARRYGIPTPTVTLLPIGGVARLQRMPDEPGQEFVVAIAGPLVNVAIAVGLYVAAGGSASMSAAAHLDEQQVGLLSKLFSINVILVVFNLVPAFPMDGGRVLRSLLAMRMDYARATRIAASIGQVLAFGFGLLGLFGNPILLLIALFVYLGAGHEAAVVEMREATRGVAVEEAMLTGAASFEPEDPVGDAARRLVQSGQSLAPVVDADQMPRGVVSRSELVQALRQGKSDRPLRELLREDVPTVGRSTPLREALEFMQSEGLSAVTVVEGDGSLAGVLSFESIGDMLAFRSDDPAGTPS